jgi:hypothetical protein
MPLLPRAGVGVGCSSAAAVFEEPMVQLLGAALPAQAAEGVEESDEAGDAQQRDRPVLGAGRG